MANFSTIRSICCASPGSRTLQYYGKAHAVQEANEATHAPKANTAPWAKRDGNPTGRVARRNMDLIYWELCDTYVAKRLRGECSRKKILEALSCVSIDTLSTMARKPWSRPSSSRVKRAIKASSTCCAKSSGLARYSPIRRFERPCGFLFVIYQSREKESQSGVVNVRKEGNIFTSTE